MKNIGIILISVIILLSIFLVSAVAQVGFNEWGFNFTAGIFNGLLGNADMDDDPDTYGGFDTYSFGYSDADGFHEVLIDVVGTHGVGKWSKGFDIGGEDEIGAWQIFHIDGNGKIYDVDEVCIFEGDLIIFYKMQLEQDAEGKRYVITQYVINGQGIVVLEIPPGFGVRIPK